MIKIRGKRTFTFPAEKRERNRNMAGEIPENHKMQHSIDRGHRGSNDSQWKVNGLWCRERTPGRDRVAH